MENSTAQLIASLAGLLRGGQIKPYIEFINFPRYRNFEEGLQIDFDFPVTVLVGQNGTGKTSLLHALSGAPSNCSPGDWWFSTAMDPIDPDDAPNRKLPQSEKAAFWYTYKDSDGNTLRALKSRIRRAGNPDYWEPSRPVAAYGMEGKDRHPVVKMQSKYLNFKTQINAFDRCFYFTQDDSKILKDLSRTKEWVTLQNNLSKSRKRPPRVQDYLRKRAKKLRRVLIDGVHISIAGNQMHKPRVELSTAELKDLSYIMGRSYEYGALVEHRFYETWGTSVVLRNQNHEYSEAFAGSGESAVTRLVHEIHSAAKGTLFLLDEPETSLHPGAQSALVDFLLRMSRDKRLQIVISTHSPTIVRKMPREAIHVLAMNSTGQVCSYSHVPPDEAFFVLGHPIENQIELIVEDILCKCLLDAVAVSIGKQFAARFNITYRPGGDSGMKHDASTLMLDEGRNVHFVFDGDKANSIGPFDLRKIEFAVTASELDTLIEQVLGIKIRFHQNSNMPEEQKRQIRLDFIMFVNSRFHCLPINSPEAGIWSDETAKNLLIAIGYASDSANFSNDHKKRFDELTRLLRASQESPVSEEILGVQELFIRHFCNLKGSVFYQIEGLLKRIANNAD
ncbi:MAG TPA: hypothetical protein DDZ51_26370 [Planctomycetaceae bacterium]|nr:hypothetical protein [Planctomycetaceae bacterium]